MPNGLDADSQDSSPEIVDVGAQSTTEVSVSTEQTTPSTEPVENSSPPPTTPDEPRPKSAAPAKPKAEIAPDPVQLAIQKLASDFKAPVKVEPVAPATAQTKTEPAKTEDPLSKDPLTGFSDVEKFTFKEKTTGRIKDLHGRWKQAESELESIRPHAASGKEYTAFVDQYKLGPDLAYVPPDHLAGLVNAQAAVNRALMEQSKGGKPSTDDLDFIEHFSGALNATREKLGLKPIGGEKTESSIAPLAGQLPEQYQDLIDIYGLPEGDVRTLAAIAAKGSAPTKQPAPAERVRDVEVPPVAAPQAQPKGPDIADLYARRTLAQLSQLGATDPAKRLGELLRDPVTAKEVMSRFPGVSEREVAGVFNACDPRERMDILIAAHKATVKPPVKSVVNPPISSQTRQPLRGASPHAMVSPSAKGDQVRNAIDFLASDR